LNWRHGPPTLDEGRGHPGRGRDTTAWLCFAVCTWLADRDETTAPLTQRQSVGRRPGHQTVSGRARSSAGPCTPQGVAGTALKHLIAKVRSCETVKRGCGDGGAKRPVRRGSLRFPRILQPGQNSRPRFAWRSGCVFPGLDLASPAGSIAISRSRISSHGHRCVGQMYRRHGPVPAIAPMVTNWTTR
jgi:hypothetical protein